MYHKLCSNNYHSCLHNCYFNSGLLLRAFNCEPVGQNQELSAENEKNICYGHIYTQNIY